MPAFLPMILHMLVGMGGWTAARTLARKLVGKQAGNLMKTAGAKLAGPVTGAVGQRVGGWAGTAGRYGAQSVAEVVPGMIGYEAATQGYESLFGDEQTPESGAQLEHSNPPVGAQQSAVLDQVQQEEQLRGMLRELGIDLDDLLSQQGGYGGLV